MRTVARTELPSTKAAITCARVLLGNRFMPTSIQAVTHKVKYKMDATDSNFNWVAARAKCSASKLFDVLRLDAERDVASRNRVRDLEQEPYAFTFTHNGSAFTVRCEGKVPERRGVVDFQLTGEGKAIVVTREGKLLFEVSPGLSQGGACKFKVGDEDLEAWQVLMKALEPLFF